MAYVVCMILNQSLCQTCCDICWCKELNFYIHALKEFIKQMSKGRSVRGCWQQSKTQSANENTASQGMAGFYSTFTDKTESFCWGWAIWGATSSRERKCTWKITTRSKYSLFPCCSRLGGAGFARLHWLPSAWIICSNFSTTLYCVNLKSYHFLFFPARTSLTWPNTPPPNLGVPQHHWEESEGG